MESLNEIIPPPSARKIGDSYNTPKGRMTWMEDGWHPVEQSRPETPAKIPSPTERKIGESYDTPKGRMTWMEDGWHPVSGGSAVSDAISDATRPIKRIPEIAAAEAKAGATSVARGIKGEPDKETGETPGALSRAADIGLGSVQWAFSWLTGASRALAGEPVKETLNAAGAPTWLSEGAGMAAEIGVAAALPGAAVKAGKELRRAVEAKTATRFASDSFQARAAKELADRALEPVPKSSIDKAREFLATDLSKVEIPPIGADRHVNYLNYLITEDDVKRSMFAAEKIRGSSKITVPHAETERLALKSGITVKDLLARGSRDGSSATQLATYESIKTAAGENMSALAKRITSGAASDTEKLVFHAQFDEYLRILKSSQGANSEVGRALNYLRSARKSSIGIENAVKLAEQGNVKQLGTGELAKLVSMADNPVELAKAIDKFTQATKSQAAVELWKSMLLSGLRTHEANFVGNMTTTISQIPERAVAAALGKLHGGDKVFFRELPAQIAGAYNGAIEGASLAARTMRHGITAESAEKIIDAGRVSAIKGSTFGLTGKSGKAVDVAGEVIRLPFRFLGASDEFFKTTAMRMELHSLATRQALSEGLSGKKLAERIMDIVHNPTEDLIERATQYGKYVTFNKELGETGKAVMHTARTHPFLQVIMPFIRTPTNIIKYAGERTALAVFSQAVRRELAKGGAARDLAIAKMMTGTALSTWAAYAAMEGKITGGGPTDPDLRRNLYQTGWKPYSLKIGDKYYQYNRFDPFATLIGAAADAVEINKFASTEENARIAAMIAAAFSKNVTSKTFTKGISDIVNAVSDPDRYGAWYIHSLAGSAVPTIVSDVAQSRDPILRDILSMQDAIMARTPYASDKVLPKRDIYGAEIKRHKGGADPFLIIAPSADVKDRAYTELNRLGIQVKLPRRTIGGKEIDPKLYDAYQQLAGQTAKKGIDMLVNSEAYENMPRSVKESFIKDIFNTARQAARIKLGLETAKSISDMEKMKRGLLER